MPAVCVTIYNGNIVVLTALAAEILRGDAEASGMIDWNQMEVGPID